MAAVEQLLIYLYIIPGAFKTDTDGHYTFH